MSEIGPEGFKKFRTAKHFTSWLRLAPNNKILRRKAPEQQGAQGQQPLEDRPATGSQCDRQPEGHAPLGLLQKNRLQKGEAFGRERHRQKTGRNHLEHGHEENVLRSAKTVPVPRPEKKNGTRQKNQETNR